MKNKFALSLLPGVLALLGMLGCPATVWAQQSGYSLNFNGANNYASLSLVSPPASNYTITAWVNLRTGGTQSGTRMAVLGGTNCGDSVEFLIHSATSSAADPQYLELGRCSGFNGFLSTNAVLTNAWTHLAVTLSSNKTVSYYINGSPSGIFTDTVPTDSYLFGSTARLGDNNGTRAFDGKLYNVQIWNRILSATEVTNNLTQQLAGNETGLYAWYPFTEGSGATTADAATAAGGSAATLVNSPGWIPAVGLVVTNTADSGAGTLRQDIPNAIPDRTITFSTNLAGATITLTTGPLLVNENLAIDGSALSNSVIFSGNNASGIFYVGSNATVSLTGLTLVNGNEYDGGAVYGGPNTSVTLTRCTMSGNSAVEGGALLNDGAMVVNECTLANNFASYGGAMQNRGATTISQCTISGNDGYYGGGGLWVNAQLLLSNSIVAGNSVQAGTASNLDIEITGGLLTYSSSNLVQFTADLVAAAPTGPAPLTNAPLLSPLGNYGGPMQTMLPMTGSPVIDAAVANSFTVDQRGFPRVVGPAPDLGAVEFQDASSVVTTIADSGLGSLRYAATYTTNGQVITFDNSLSGSTILLTNGQIVLKPNLTIDASALPGGIQINGNTNSRIFQINNTNTVVLNSLIITNGNGVGATASGYGGGIYASGSGIHLTLNNCLLTANYAAQFGGGLFSAMLTALAVNGTTFSSNHAPVGAGTCVESETGTFNDCTFAGNFGAGLQCSADGQKTVVSLMNSTVSGNVSTNIYASAIDLRSFYTTMYTITLGLTNCTITSNSSLTVGKPGAVNFPGISTNYIYLYNTIISGNTSNGAPQDLTGFLNPYDIVTGNYNIIGRVIVGTGLANGVNGNKVGVFNPQLAPLGNYGGNTLTMPPLLGSPAVDAGGATSLTTDQRGYPRPLGLATDIGAVEGVYNAAGSGPITQVAVLGNGSLQFGFTNYTDMAFTVLASTNLTLPLNLWTNIGYIVESPAGSGQYQLTDPQATNYPQRYYRLRSP
jgi:hypothetical protein